MSAPFDMDPAGIIETERAGEIVIPGVGTFDAKAWTQDLMWDTEEIGTVAVPPVVAAGEEYRFFRSTNFQITTVRKNRLDTNMVVEQQMPSGWKAWVYNMGFRVINMENAPGGGVFTTPEDVQRIMTGGVAQFITGNQKVEKEGPLEAFPCPIGMTGMIMRTGAAATTFSAVNNGIASLGATPNLDIAINLSRELTFEAVVRWPYGLQLDARCKLQMVLFCYVAKPVR